MRCPTCHRTDPPVTKYRYVVVVDFDQPVSGIRRVGARRVEDFPTSPDVLGQVSLVAFLEKREGDRG